MNHVAIEAEYNGLGIAIGDKYFRWSHNDDYLILAQMIMQVIQLVSPATTVTIEEVY